MTRSFLIAALSLVILPLTAHAQTGWLLYRGNPQRTGDASTGPALHKPVAWQRPLLMDEIFDGAKVRDDDKIVKELIDQLRKDADPTILPGFFPLIVDGKCIYRNHRQWCAAALQPWKVIDDFTGRLEVYRPSEIVWKTIEMPASLAGVLQRPRMGLSQLFDALKAAKLDRWQWANPLIGSVSSDGKDIFAIDDLVFSRPEKPNPLFEKKQLFGDMTDRFKRNDLVAYRVHTGHLLWDTSGSAPFPLEQIPVFPRAYFLGSPLPLDGKLYVLSEKAGKLQLATVGLEPMTWRPIFKTTTALTTVPAAEQIEQSPLRRTQPLHLAYADGLLVCPSHAGVVFGVDRAKMEIRWQYRYRDEKTAAPELPVWQSACPIIVKDRIVFTAADAPEVHCIDRAGKKQWTAAADQDLYLATVHDGLVLLVGKSHCRALGLADGKEKWRLETGLPAGVGVKAGPLYYLPLKVDAQTKGPTLWGIDIAKGRKVQRIDVPFPEALGNLALDRGQFVSQSVTYVAAFPLALKTP